MQYIVYAVQIQLQTHTHTVNKHTHTVVMTRDKRQKDKRKMNESSQPLASEFEQDVRFIRCQQTNYKQHGTPHCISSSY